MAKKPTKKSAKKSNKSKSGDNGADAPKDPQVQKALDQIVILESSLHNAGAALNEAKNSLTQSTYFLDKVVYDDNKTSFADDNEKAAMGENYTKASELIFAGRNSAGKSSEDDAAWKYLVDNYISGVEQTSGKGKNKSTIRVLKEEVSAEDEKSLGKYAEIARMVCDAKKDAVQWKYFNDHYMAKAGRGKNASYKKSEVKAADSKAMGGIYTPIAKELCSLRKAAKAKPKAPKASTPKAPAKDAATEAPVEPAKPEYDSTWQKLRYHPLEALADIKCDAAQLLVDDNLAKDAKAAKGLVAAIQANPLQAFVYAVQGEKHMQNALSQYAMAGQKKQTFASMMLAEYVSMIEPLVKGASLCDEVMALANYKPAKKA